ASSALDRAAKRGASHRNSAARRKSRLARAAAKAKAAS
ncbi:MAG: 30S ribosomal protein S20, partial [Candidatus Limnocylindria bacterium]